MERKGDSGMQGVFGLLLVVGGIILIVMVLSDLANFGQGFHPFGLGTSGGAMGPLPAGYQPPPSVKAGAPVGTAVNHKCPAGFVNVNGVCFEPVGVPAKGR